MNLKFIRVMVPKDNWQVRVVQLISPYNEDDQVIASRVDEKTHGYVIKIGSKSKEILDIIAERATEL